MLRTAVKTTVRMLEEGGVQEPQASWPMRPQKRRRKLKAQGYVVFACVAYCCWVASCASSRLAARVLVDRWMASENLQCACASDAAIHWGVPSLLARAAPRLVRAGNVTLWNPVEVQREGAQRSIERSARCPAAPATRLRAIMVTVESKPPWGRRRRHTLRDAEAACVQHMMDVMRGRDPCVHA